MAIKTRHRAAIVCLAMLASLWPSDHAVNQDARLSHVKIEVQAQTAQAGAAPDAAGIFNPFAGKIFENAVVRQAEASMRGEPSDRAAAAEKVAASEGPDIDLAGVDRLRVRVWGQSEASGEYGIEFGSLSLPGVGRLPVAGQTLQSLEAQLSARMSAAMRREVQVSVEILRFRQFYATGLVARAGAVDWRPGLTVIQAIALSGGVVRNNGVEQTPERAVAVQQTRSQLQFALAQYERLNAEKEGSDVVAHSARLKELNAGSADVNRATVAGFLNRQNQVLEEQKASLNSQIASLEREKTAALREVEAAEVQTRVAAKQVEITRHMMTGLNQLMAQGNIANARYLSQQNDMLAAEVRLAESRAHVERARARVASIDRQVTILRQERRATLNDRIEALEREIAQHELALAAAGVPREGDTPSSVEFSIARKSQSGVATVSANLFTEILPDDVLIVSSTSDRGAHGLQLSAAPRGFTDGTTSLARAHRSIDASAVSSTAAAPDQFTARRASSTR